MTEDTDRQMTIPELLDARAQVKRQLDLPTLGAWRMARAPAGRPDQAALRAILEEIEAELAELGYREAGETEGFGDE